MRPSVNLGARRKAPGREAEDRGRSTAGRNADEALLPLQCTVRAPVPEAQGGEADDGNDQGQMGNGEGSHVCLSDVETDHNNG